MDCDRQERDRRKSSIDGGKIKLDSRRETGSRTESIGFICGRRLDIDDL